MSLKKQRIIGLDVGDKRIGIAISDPLCKFAQPLATITNTKENLKWLDKIAVENEVNTIVVGLPLTLKGERGLQAQKVIEFAEKLKSLGFKVILWDERMTTKMAERMLISADSKRKERKEIADKVAAVLILQSYLDSINENED